MDKNPLLVSKCVIKTEEKDGVKTEYEMDTVKGVKHGVFKIYHSDGETVSIERNYKMTPLKALKKYIMKMEKSS